jgi:glycosyltransferase involved in cell wall biosynthesis
MNSSITNTASYAPIALFVYNRPDHARQTIEALKENELSVESDLIIFADGPKNSGAQAKVNEVRELIKNVSGFRSLTIHESPNNKGLANSIIDGVTKVCEEYGRIIVLEDDLVISPWFLKYMNDALDLYENDSRVISVHGYMYPVKERLPETFFLRGADCWGWGTWKRGWDNFESDARILLVQVESSQLEKEFNYDGAYDLLSMLRAQVRGKVNSWAIRWYGSAFLKNKLTLYPGKSLVLNIGIDGSGTHCGTAETFSGIVADQPVKVERVPVSENAIGRASVVKFYLDNKKTVLGKIFRKITQMISRRK